MVNPEFEKLEKEIADLNAEIEQLNESCAIKLNEITGNKDSRIMSFGEEEKLKATVDEYTKRLAKLIVELEELEEVKRLFLESIGEE